MAENFVAEPNDEWSALSPFWELIQHIRGGTAAMRNAGKLYLPQEPAEGETAYFNRLSRSVFTNFYSKAIDVLVGKPLQEPITLQEDVPTDIKTMLENVDLQGNDLTTFAEDILQQAIDDGVTHVLVDFPPTADQIQGEFPDGSLTLEQERRFGIRPYAVHVRAMDLIGWKYETAPNGEKTLTQIRYREVVKGRHPENPFKQIDVERIRVYEIGRVTVYEKRKEEGGEEEWFKIQEYTTTLRFIPLATFYTNKIGFMVGQPLMLDFAYLNVAHWQSDSDQRNIVHVARVPILFGTGLGTGEEGQASFSLEVGAGTFTKGPKNSDLKYVELEGKSIDAGQKDLDNLVERMEAMASSFLLKKPAGSRATATGMVIDTLENESELGILARALETYLDTVLDLFGVWLNKGEDAGGSTKVFKDFSAGALGGEDLQLLQKDRATGDISRRTYWGEQQRRGVLSDDFDPEREEELLDAESAGLGDGDGEDFPTGEAGVGDYTGTTDGHRHELLPDGTTSEAAGHTHTWQPGATRTGTTDDHSHTIGGGQEPGSAEEAGQT